MHRFLPALAFLSGVSGIAYEVLYMRLISAYLGNIFYVSAALLATFFFGIALGSFASNRYVAHLKSIEMVIGLYAIALAFAFKVLGLSITTWVSAFTGLEVLTLPIFVFVVLAIPAVAIGFSLPLFAVYIEHYRKREQTFSATYAIYNTGAALSVIAIEYLLVWKLGISKSIYLIALINVLISLALRFIGPPRTGFVISSFELIHNLTPHARRTLTALGIVSVVSGIMQLNFFNLSQYIIGPHNENFALLIGTSLLGITLAALAVRYSRLKFEQSLLLAAVISLIPFLFLTQILDIYVSVYSKLIGSTTGVILARFYIVALIALPIFFAFSTTIPAIVKDKGVQYAGVTLSVSAAGNAIGYLVYIFVIHNHLLHLVVVIGSSCLIGLTYLWYTSRHRLIRALSFSFVISGLSYANIMLWPSALYSSNYNDKLDPIITKQLGTAISTESIRRFGSDSTVVTRQNGNRELYFNGYRSLTFSSDDLTVIRESLVGTVAAYLTDKHDSALVFGLGSGVTASATADVYQQVTVAEINPTMVETAAKFSRQNDNILSKDNVSIQLQDGLITLLSSEIKYDAIINTVPSPRFFSANKLWTADVYNAAKKRLNPSGVFVGWIDNQLGQSGLDITENTLNSSFSHCVYLYLNSGYQAYICSDNELRFTPRNDSDIYPVLTNILKHKGWNSRVDVLVKNLLYKSNRDLAGDIGVNTLDTPLLEFIYNFPRDYTDIMTSLIKLLDRDAFSGEKKDRLCEVLRITDPKRQGQGLALCP